MDILSRLSRQTIRVGSSSACEICLSGEGVAPIHAELIHRGAGKISFVPSSAGKSYAGQQELVPGLAVDFDFSVPFRLGTVTLPSTHPDLCLMVISRGALSVDSNELLVGRDPERCHLVMSSPGVSGLHVSLKFSPTLQATDERSTSGTWLNGERLLPGQGRQVENTDVLAIGPLPLPMSLAQELHHGLSQRNEKPIVRTAAMPMRTMERQAIPSSIPGQPSSRHRTIMGTVKMTHSAVFTIGRTPDNDIVLDYAQVSSRHAKLTQIGDHIFLEDCGSELGTYVRGSRLKSGQRAQVGDGEAILFGPMPALLKLVGERVEVIVEDHEGWAGRPLFDIAAAGISVRVQDRDDPKKEKTLLDDVHFRALPGDLVALMGPSGSGKTTLLHALTGYVRPQAGEVLVNGSPLPEVFESLRGSIGYVPQDDIIHPELTVFEAVHYSARFRLPADYSAEEINHRVHSTLTQLGLESVAHLQIGRPEHKILSGGQRKRVNIAIELVTDPVLLFLDEPTSGLAADDTTALIELLARLARDYGKTIIATIHQPARDEYEKFNIALILGHGGIPLYFGPTREAYSFFEKWRGFNETRGIENPRDMFAELKERETRLEKELPGQSRQKVREAVSRAYRKEFEGSQVAQQMANADRSTQKMSPRTAKSSARSHPSGQLRLLLSRYLKIKSRDRVGSSILLLQAPLIGLLLSLVFGASKDSVPYWCLGALNELAKKGNQVAEASTQVLTSLPTTADHAGAIFFLVVAAVWFGTSNAAREIVSERAIFRRERMVNLGITNYVLSKFLVLCALSTLQCAILLSIVFFSLGLGGGALGFASSLGLMTLTAFASVSLGLLLSAAVASSEAAMALTPIALIPQVVLGGLMVPVTSNPLLKYPMMLMPSRWGFEGIVRTERLAVQEQAAWKIPLTDAPNSLPDFIQEQHFYCALAQMESTELRGAWGFLGPHWLPPLALLLMALGLLVCVRALLRRHS